MTPIVLPPQADRRNNCGRRLTEAEAAERQSLLKHGVDVVAARSRLEPQMPAVAAWIAEQR